MKKFISFMLAFIFVLSATGCNSKTDDTTDDTENVTEETSAKEENTTKEPESTTVIEANYYTGVVFTELKTFDEVTGLTYQESDETKTGKTVFKYITFDNATQAINDFKTYLLEYGFKMTSGVNANTQKFEYEENTLSIESSSGSSGTIISITIPCDEATTEARKAAFYTEAETAFNNGEYKKVIQIFNNFDKGKDYNNLIDYYNFSCGAVLYNNGYYSEAVDSFNDCPETMNTEEYMTKINKVFEKTNGIYKKSGYSWYFVIKDGKLAFTSSSTEKLEYYEYSWDLEFYVADEDVVQIDIEGFYGIEPDGSINSDTYYYMNYFDTYWSLTEPGSTQDLLIVTGLEGSYTKISNNTL